MLLIFMSVGGQKMTVKVKHNYEKIALQIILHLAKPVVGFLDMGGWLEEPDREVTWPPLLFLPVFLPYGELEREGVMCIGED